MAHGSTRHDTHSLLLLFLGSESLDIRDGDDVLPFKEVTDGTDRGNKSGNKEKIQKPIS